jgi:hypothetical protein
MKPSASRPMWSPEKSRAHADWVSTWNDTGAQDVGAAGGGLAGQSVGVGGDEGVVVVVVVASRSDRAPQAVEVRRSRAAPASVRDAGDIARRVAEIPRSAEELRGLLQAA